MCVVVVVVVAFTGVLVVVSCLSCLPAIMSVLFVMSVCSACPCHVLSVWSVLPVTSLVCLSVLHCKLEQDGRAEAPETLRSRVAKPEFASLPMFQDARDEDTTQESPKTAQTQRKGSASLLIKSCSS